VEGYGLTHSNLFFMKLRRSKLETMYLLSTKTNECLASTLPSSLREMADETFLYSLRITFETGSCNVTFFFTSLVVIRVEVATPITEPEASLTGY
jgi:hypothetical protein